VVQCLKLPDGRFGFRCVTGGDVNFGVFLIENTSELFADSRSRAGDNEDLLESMINCSSVKVSRGTSVGPTLPDWCSRFFSVRGGGSGEEKDIPMTKSTQSMLYAVRRVSSFEDA